MLFGAPMAELPLVQAKLADMALGVDASALLVYRAAWTKDTRRPRVTREAAMAKLHATESAQRMIDDAVQLFGGLGVTSGQAVERLYREIRALRIYEGASEVQQLIIGREVLAMTAVRFVLVHGSWHDGSLWKPVADQLDVAGHAVTTPTLGGPRQGRRQGRLARRLRAFDRRRTSSRSELHDVVLVGHSFGGTVIARVAGEIPERIRRLVFWNAFVPEDGNCLNDEVPPHYSRDCSPALAAASDDNTVMLPYPIWREAFINDADEELARVVLRAALVRAVPLLHRQARPRRVLRVRRSRAAT